MILQNFLADSLTFHNFLVTFGQNVLGLALIVSLALIESEFRRPRCEHLG